MKSTVKGVLWVALIVLATFSNAGVDDTLAEVSVTGAKTFSVKLKAEDVNAKATLRDAKGRVLSSRVFRDGITAFSFDLNALEEGEYELKIVDDQISQTFPLIITKDQLLVDRTHVYTFYFPTVYQQGNQVTVSKYALQPDKIQVSILGRRRTLIFNEVIEEPASLGRRYDFSNLQQGVYEMRIVSDGQTISRNITVK